MKTALFASLAVTLIASIRAVDDGRYRPEVNDNSGKYNPTYLGRNGQYYSNFGAYQPQFYNPLRPYQQLSVPFVQYKKDNSVVPGVTYRPPAVTTTALPAVIPKIQYTTQPKAVYAKTHANEGYARIIEQDNDVNDNSYQYKYRTENGISAGETGVVGGTQGGTRVAGFYEYIGADGLTYRVDYTADENGFHPTGAHLP